VFCMFSATYLVRDVFASTYFLATLMGTKNRRSATMSNLQKYGEVDPDNIAKHKLSAEDH
jgi:hypothetical protein